MDVDEAGDMSLLGDPSTPMGGTVGAMGGTDLDSVFQGSATTMMPTFNSSELGWLQAPDVGSAVLAIGQRVFVDEGTMEGVSGRRAEGFFGVITRHHDNGDYGVKPFVGKARERRGRRGSGESRGMLYKNKRWLPSSARTPSVLGTRHRRSRGKKWSQRGRGRPARRGR